MYVHVLLLAVMMIT